ncbi:hypothetical protein ACQEVC_34035 [Plantactinospora sp. CA-294935]|uniref:hypothetical protein n=1 Tax=Plantactinospora sp. CA-294935 TaxID=3240012 RepID=UPI003D8CB71E
MDIVDLVRATCPDCSAEVGQPHADRCDTAQCRVTGMRRWGCQENDPHHCGTDAWRGDWSGHRECREFGWHVRWDSGANRWARCSPDVPGSGPDLDRLYEQARWDVDSQRWVQRRASLFSRSTRGGRPNLEETAQTLRRWCDAAGYAVVAEHLGARGWASAVADLTEGRADVVAVPSVDGLGEGQQVFTRITEVRRAGGTVVGPGVQLAGTSLLLSTTLAEPPAKRTRK